MAALVLQCPAKYIDFFLKIQPSLQLIGLWNKFYLATDYQDELELDNFHIKGLDKDYGFSGNLIRLMPEVGEDVFFFAPEDHRPIEVNVTACLKTLAVVVNRPEIGMLRLFRFSQYLLQNESEFVSPLEKRKRFYIALGGMSIWRKDYFQKFLKDGETAWDFERKCMEKILTDDDYRAFGTNTTIYKHFNTATKGALNPAEKVKNFI